MWRSPLDARCNQCTVAAVRCQPDEKTAHSAVHQYTTDINNVSHLTVIIIIIIYSFNEKLTSATCNNASTRYIISPKACKRKRLIVCPKAKNNFNETYFQKLSLQTEQMGGFMAKNTKSKQTN